MNFRYRLIRFLSGRYGPDTLFYVLFAASAVLALINIIVRSLVLQITVYIIVAFAIFRVFSRNYQARSRENRVAEACLRKAKNRINLRRQRKADFTHIYKKCPYCRAVLRLPRKKGKHTTVCPKCGKSFGVRVYR